jgi:hypothetical protein
MVCAATPVAAVPLAGEAAGNAGIANGCIAKLLLLTMLIANLPHLC